VSGLLAAGSGLLALCCGAETRPNEFTAQRKINVLERAKCLKQGKHVGIHTCI
jgi:hypothetical protein